MRITISKENYLKAIAEAESEGEPVKAVTLSHWLGVSAPAVTMAVRRLKRDGLILVDGEGSIELTGAGREIAGRLLHRHNLVERMLTEIFGLEWYKVHDEAEQLEHAISDDFARKLSEKLGPDAPCPHGNRMGMDAPADRRGRGWKPLSEALPPQQVTVEAVFERDRKLLERLDSIGIRPGVRLSIASVSAGRIVLEAGGREVPVDPAIAGRVWVSNG